MDKNEMFIKNCLINKKVFKKKIVFLYNKYEREHLIINFIEMELKKQSCKVFEIGMLESGMIKKIMLIRPDIIVTFPITTLNQIYVYSFFKIIFKCRIITFTTEGILDYNDLRCIKEWCGYYNYSNDLIDYHVYWGQIAARRIGNELLKQKKLKNMRGVRVFGNPMYEKEKIYRYCHLEKQYELLFRKWEKIILVLTGFTVSEYSIEDCINAQDIVNLQNKNKKQIMNDPVLKNAQKTNEKLKIYSYKYIDAIINAAKKNKDFLYIVKLHPTEISVKNKVGKLRYINRLKNFKNIIIIDKCIPIGLLLPYSKLLIHYGSTVDLEAYLYGIPTLKLEARSNEIGSVCETRRLTQSTYYEDVENIEIISEYTEKIRKGEIVFKLNAQTEKALKDIMNYEVGQKYNPSKEFANFLCSDLKRNKLSVGFSEYNMIFKWIVKKYFD